MTPKKISGKTVWAVSLAVALVAVVLILLFASQTPSQQRENITLPTAPVETPMEPEPEETPKENFLNVTNENVLTALQSLSRPMSYHQTYTVTVGADEAQSENVQIWADGSLLRAEISDLRQTKVIISDGQTAYLWYDGGAAHISIQLEAGMAEEDLLGLPEFDAYLRLEQEQIVDSDYLVLEDPQVQCIYVCTQKENGDTTRHWVSLETGLLYQSDVLENSKQVYKIRQTQYALLAAEDESFANRFVLPDGTDPFTAAEETPQP